MNGNQVDTVEPTEEAEPDIEGETVRQAGQARGAEASQASLGYEMT